MAGHSRLKSSTTVKARNRRSSRRLSWMKSRDQRCRGAGRHLHRHDPTPAASQLLTSLGQLQTFLSIQALHPFVIDDSQFLAQQCPQPGTAKAKMGRRQVPEPLPDQVLFPTASDLIATGASPDSHREQAFR
jgi:hypothetical protein